MPDQVSLYWDNIRETLQFNLLPMIDATEEVMTNILNNLMLGGLQAWVILDEGKVTALAVTQVITELGSGEKNLLIYSLYGYSLTKIELWKESLGVLRRFAQGKDCRHIVGYTKVPRILEIAKQLGGDTSTTLVLMEV